VTNEEKDTKRKIIDAANELFAREGFAGASVRDIAKLADVNLASINYHFKNKEGLYWEVFEHNHKWVDDNIQALGKNCANTEELARCVFRFFIANEYAMMNTFKIFLSAMNPPDNILNAEDDEHFGPPGQNVFFEMIEKDTKKEIAIESKKWATKMIFSLLLHFGVILNTEFMKKKCKTAKEMSPKEVEKSLIHSVRAHLNYLKTNELGQS